MKKTLIALSLAALSSAAFADVTLYGQIKAGVEVSHTKYKSTDPITGEVATASTHTTTQIGDFGSRIGFKGHEALGNGINAIWQVENSVSVAGGGTWANRDSYIGLETTAGTIRAGRLSTQLNDMGAVDPWEYNNDALGLGIFTRTGTRVASIRYDSPVFAGFSANVQFTPRDNQTAARGTADATGRASELSDSSAYYAGLNYENSGFFAQYGLAYQKARYVTSMGKSKSGQVHRLEAGYDANNLFVGLGYQYTNGWDSVATYANRLYGDASTYSSVNNAAADTTPGVKTHEVALTASYRFGNVTPKFSYAHGFAPKYKAQDLTTVKAKDGKYDQIILGADYDFSKRTTAFAQAGWLKVGTGSDYARTTAGLVGLRHKF